MLAPQAVALFGAVYVTFLVLRYFQQLFYHRRQAKALHCEPPPAGSGGPFGIRAFLRLSQAVKEKRWIEYLAEQYDSIGRTFSQRIFTRNLISTTEPENLKAMLATQFKDFCLGNRHEEFFPLLGDGIFTLDGAGWTHSRALLRPQFARDQVSYLSIYSFGDLLTFRSPISFFWMITSAISSASSPEISPVSTSKISSSA